MLKWTSIRRNTQCHLALTCIYLTDFRSKNIIWAIFKARWLKGTLRFAVLTVFLMRWCGEQNPNLWCCGDLRLVGVRYMFLCLSRYRVRWNSSTNVGILLLLFKRAIIAPNKLIDTQHYKRHRENNDRIQFTLTLHPHKQAVKCIILKIFKLLQNDPDNGRIFSQPPLISFKRSKK